MTADECLGPLHARAAEGLRLFNERKYFEAHEALEDAWREEPGRVRELYRGILQAAVVYLHITRLNYQGALKVYRRSQRWLRGWPEVCRGVRLGQLRRDLDLAVVEVQRLGPRRMEAFDLALLRPLEWSLESR
jgi:predicted metal-dependent hydrolase